MKALILTLIVSLMQSTEGMNLNQNHHNHFYNKGPRVEQAEFVSNIDYYKSVIEAVFNGLGLN